MLGNLITKENRKPIFLLSAIASTVFNSFYFIANSFLSAALESSISVPHFVSMAISAAVIILLFTASTNLLIEFLNRKRQHKPVWTNWLIGTLVIVLTIFLFTLITHRAIPSPVIGNNINSSNNKFVFVLLPNMLFGIIIYMTLVIWNTYKQNKNLQITLAQFEKERIQLQLTALQQQMNPHFMFNSLSVLSELIYENPISANLFIAHFSKVYRYVLDYQEENLIEVSKELEFLESYLALQKTRFGDSLQFNQQVSADAFKHYIPPLALQILIENAIKHNEVSMSNPLTVTLKCIDDFLVVENNLQARVFKDYTRSKEMGLSNLRRTYQLLSNRIPVFTKTTTAFIAQIPMLSSKKVL